MIFLVVSVNNLSALVHVGAPPKTCSRSPPGHDSSLKLVSLLTRPQRSKDAVPLR
uniref:Uncharacterized protein n=1 Tax=Arundo donax TaxID=35708 RepID=A0A0A8ZNZ2_ARUDO